MTNCGKLLERWKYQIICLLRNLYAGQEETGPCMEQQIGSRLRKEYDSLMSPCLFNLYAEHIMRDAGLEELQARI